MRTLTIERFEFRAKQTMGHISLEDHDRVLCSMELPWLDNKPMVSCIPAGDYLAVPYIMSTSKRWALWLQAVPGRSEIMIHAGNFFYDTRGCILPGLQFQDLNHDGLLDVKHSAQAMAIIKHWVGDDRKIRVVVK